MLAQGNGEAEQCTFNLMSMIQGECPYDRCRGLDADITDLPSSAALGTIATSAAWLLMNYEPRVSADDAGLTVENAVQGRYRIATGVIK